jgi:hypothetical protein
MVKYYRRFIFIVEIADYSGSIVVEMSSDELEGFLDVKMEEFS